MTTAEKSHAPIHIVVLKSERRLEIFCGDELMCWFTCVLGSSPAGGKTVEGDGRTPEGEFCIIVKNEKSKFHLSLGLDYPRPSDAEAAFAKGAIGEEDLAAIRLAASDGRLPPQTTPLGGEIYIHGGGTSCDWTRGCVALENADMERLFAIAKLGTRVTIRP